MACTYIFNGKKYDSYTELIEQLDSADIDKALSILYSLKQDDVYDNIVELKKEYKFKQWQKNTYNGIDGEPSIDAGENMSIQQFIDSHYFMIDGESPTFKLVFEEYLAKKKEHLVKSQHLSEEEAELLINTQKDRWEIIAKDAYDLHRIIVSTKSSNDSTSYQELSANTVGTSFQVITDKVKDAADKVIGKVFLKHGLNKLTGDGKGRLIKNINLSAQLKGLDEEIIGHIDYLIVKDNGDIEIFNIKSSTESYSEWDPIKKEKYRYQMSFIKRILEFNGIPAKNIRMNIIPVKMVYDPNFEYIQDLQVENVVPMDFHDNTYLLQNHDRIVSRFIPSNVTLEPVNNEIAFTIDKQLQKIFPGRDLQTYGIKETASTWVDKYWKQLQPKPLDEGGWEITIPGDKEPIQVSDPRHGSKNEEIVNLVRDRLDDLSNNISNEKGIYKVISDIRNAYARSGFYTPSGEYGVYLQDQFGKYFDYGQPEVKDGKFLYTWKLIDNELLNNAGILIFQNKYTHQLDVVTLTTYDVTTKYQFKGRKHLLGYYLPDANNEGFTMESNYGNIEAIRTMTILNEILPSLQGDFKLGELKVLGISHQIHGKKGALFDFSRLVPQFHTVVKTVNKNTDLGMHNNFREHNLKYVDQADILIQQWQEIISNTSSSGDLSEIKALDQYITQRYNIDGTIIDGLTHAQTLESKVEKLELLVAKLRELAAERGIPLGKTKQLLDMSKRNSNDLNTAIAKLYIGATKALNQYFGDLSLENEDFGALQEYMLKNNSISNSNVRQVGFMFQKTIDKVANDMLTRYSPIREIFMKFYEDAGYTKTQNAIIGNQASVYKNLYETDENGNRLMQFKNPYDISNDLKDYEREFLKKILYEFHKVRCEVIGIKNNLTGYDDASLQTKLPAKYLNVPLEHASAGTRRTNVKNGFQDWGRRVARRIFNPGEYFEEMQGLVGNEEVQQREYDINNLQAYNPFKNSESSDNIRNSYISEKGVDYFEYNVENLLIDFMEKHIQSQEYTKLLTRAKGIELDLILRGEVEINEAKIEHTLKAIDDFLKINVFNQSIMEESSQKLESYLQPLRSMVSAFYVAGNVTGAVRDSFQGLLENITSAIIKFQTEIDAKDVAFGYKEVIAEGVGNLMVATKLNQFNLKYRFSNLDAARISEGQKTGRGGILNAENWAYSTLRSPDYLNRMVLFVAKMKHDGCYDAYSLDENGRLKYEWRKDKRFDLLAANDKSDIEAYNKQKALYYSLIRAFNLDGYKKANGEQLNFSDDLPDAYTLQEIQTFKTFSDNIYGSYNKSTKAKYEHTAIGRNFAFFSTWMNGIVDVYMKQTQVSQGESKLEQEYDYNGNPLFFNEDGTVTIVNTGVPVMHGVPIMVQGVFATLGQVCKTLYHCGMDENGKWSMSKGWTAVRTDIWTNEVARRNRRRFIRDILIGGLLTALFKLWLNNKYKEYKANADGDKIIANACVEVLFKAGGSCFDTFLGPFAMLDYIGNQTNPATYKLQSKMLHDVWALAIGEKSFRQMLVGSQALPRSFQDTYKLWARDNKPQPTQE